MMHELRTGLPLPKRHRQGGHDEVLPDARLHGPPHDPPRVQIEHDGEIQPPFIRAHVGDVAGPDSVGTQGGEVAVQDIAGDAMPSHGMATGLQFRAHRGVPYVPSLS